MRKFKGDAIRDTNEGKISYYGFRHPLCEHSFGEYMERHQTCADGSKRKADNWWSGWSEDVSIDSLVRHAEDLQAIHAGLFVYKVRGFKGERTIVSTKMLKELEGFGARVSKEDAYNAIRFNSTAGLLEYLKTK